ncbi:uncharacterized protein [Periplaneta americana]|uniref:uncharacterized protein isoform X2 n=1 Tax=Periplaneta americana TaxID=6978 RepID=UPI0037E72F66
MDVVKMEPEFDPLAIPTCDNTDVEEKKPSREEVDLLTQHSTQIKGECVDHSYSPAAEMTFEEARVPINFTFVKCELDDQCDLDRVKEELKVEVTEEEDENFTKSEFMRS